MAGMPSCSMLTQNAVDWQRDCQPLACYGVCTSASELAASA